MDSAKRNDGSGSVATPSPLNADSAGFPAPPVAATKPYTVAAPHGATRQDEYYWLRDDLRRGQEILEYLKVENAYADAVMSPLKILEDKLYQELLGRIKQDDSSVPYRYKDYWYYTRFEEGREHPIHARRKRAMEAPEQVILDVNHLAADKSFCHVVVWRISPNQEKVAYLEDAVGRRQYTLRIKNLATGETYPDEIRGLGSTLAWGGDNRTVYYVDLDDVRFQFRTQILQDR